MTTGIASTGLAAHGDLRGGGAALSDQEQAACDGCLARFKHKLDTRRMTLADWFKVNLMRLRPVPLPLPPRLAM